MRTSHDTAHYYMVGFYSTTVMFETKFQISGGKQGKSDLTDLFES